MKTPIILFFAILLLPVLLFAQTINDIVKQEQDKLSLPKTTTIKFAGFYDKELKLQSNESILDFRIDRVSQEFKTVNKVYPDNPLTYNRISRWYYEYLQRSANNFYEPKQYNSFYYVPGLIGGSPPKVITNNKKGGQ